MASLAGVDPTAETGVTGGVEKVMMMEPSAEKREATGEKSQELDHTNIKMSMDVLTRQFIYQGTYQWRTSDSPGTVIATFPIHPDSCNMYTSHVYKMFGAYVGGMKARMRIIGTAFYGGGLYMVRVPPQYKPSDIAQFGLAGMTAFPHTDVDPKNLDSVDILLEDFRSEHFHTGPLDTNDPKSFGGWLALVVNARLVTQTAEIRSLDLRMEFAGDFQFQVPVPIRTGVTNLTGPLATLNVSDLIGTDDAFSSSGSTYLNVMPTNEKIATAGNIFHKRAGGNYLYDASNSFVAGTGSATWNVLESLRDSFDRDTLRITLISVISDGEWLLFNTATDTMTPVNITLSTKSRASWTYIGVDSGDVKAFKIEQATTGVDGTRTLARFKGSYQIPKDAFTNVAYNGGTDICTFTDFHTIITPNRDDRAIGDESYVVIANNGGASINTQAKAWARELSDYKQWPLGSAAIFGVLNKSGTIIAYLKLRENGHMYAPATTAAYTINGAVKLRFIQWTPENDPLPIVTATQRMMMNAATNQAVRDAVNTVTTKFSALRLAAAQ